MKSKSSRWIGATALAAFLLGCGGGAEEAPEATSSVIHGCGRASAVDRTGAEEVEIGFGDVLGYAYEPRCLVVDAGTRLVFKGNFGAHPLEPGRLDDDGVVIEPGNPIQAVILGEMAVFPADTSGAYGFYCSKHAAEGMTGAVFVEGTE